MSPNTFDNGCELYIFTVDVLEKMIETTGSTGLMHEGFHADDPSRYTREWFSWANAMYSEMVLNYLGYELAV